MTIEAPTALLRIYLGESDHVQGTPAHHRIVALLRERGIAGATATRGIEGYGAKQHLHTDRILSLSGDLPIVIEAVDREDRLRAIVPELEGLLGDGLVVLLAAEVLAHRSTR
jgi:PII-like signaling protein